MVLDLLTSHASVRAYKDVPLQKEEVYEFIRAGQHAASSNFVQAYSVIYVTDQEKREKLAELSNNPKQILGAGAVLVFCMDFYRLKRAAALVEKKIDFSSAEHLLVGVTDVALFAQNVAIAAESRGYGICYIGGVRNAPAEISELFSMPEGVVPMFGMTIGVPDEDNEVKPRLPIEAVVHENGYTVEKYIELLPSYDETMNVYYKSRGTNNKDTNWSETMAAFLGSPRRTYMKAFLEEKGFNLK